MTRRPVRLSRTLHKVLEVIVSSPPTAPAWSGMIRERTGLSFERVLRAVDRMVQAGWVEVVQECPDGWERRFYRVTAAGRVRWEEAVEAEGLPSRRQILLRWAGHGG